MSGVDLRRVRRPAPLFQRCPAGKAGPLSSRALLGQTSGVMTKIDCRDCTHFRSSPWEASREGCYLPANMPQKHKERYLDEQQIPGDHEKINLRGDCPDFQARPAKVSLLKRLFAPSS